MKRAARIAASIAGIVCIVFVLSPIPVLGLALLAQIRWPDQVRSILISPDSHNKDYGKR
jgi:hypothetical protein